MEKIWDSNRLIVRRFVCECMGQGHSMEVSVEKGEDGVVLECSFSFFLVGKSSLKWRIKNAWYALCGKDIDEGEFYLRLEDMPNLISLLSEMVSSPYTSSGEVK